MSEQSSQLAGKVAIVTGASGGIGSATAKAFAAAGAAVVVHYNGNKAAADAVVSAIAKRGGKAIAFGGDIAKRADAERVAEAAVSNFGRLDALVNNAGVAEFSPIGELTEEQYRRVFDTNVLGTLLMTQAAVKHMKEGASIINVGSVGVRFALPNSSLYIGSKGALDTITNVLANELGPNKIRVNALIPGMIATEKSLAAGIPSSDFGKMMVSRTPLGRIGTPEECATVAVFLASDASAWVSGEHIHVAGGAR